MRYILSVLLFSFVLCATAQNTPQLTQVPPKPTCTPILPNGACANLWRAYNQALAQRQREELQIYVDRQKELASESATAPLQQQITDLNNLVADQQAQIKKLQDQMQADATAALQAAAQAKDADAAALLAAKDAAHKQGLWVGIGIGAGTVLILILVILGGRRFTQNFTITKKSQSASA